MSDESGNASAFCCPMVDEDKGAIYSIFHTVVVLIYISIPEFTVGILYSKPSKTDKKTRWTDKPSWVNKGIINSDLTAAENASRILNDKYGRGNWGKGPRSEFNIIVKWIIRSGFLLIGGK